MIGPEDSTNNFENYIFVLSSGPIIWAILWAILWDDIFIIIENVTDSRKT